MIRGSIGIGISVADVAADVVFLCRFGFSGMFVIDESAVVVVVCDEVCCSCGCCCCSFCCCFLDFRGFFGFDSVVEVVVAALLRFAPVVFALFEEVVIVVVVVVKLFVGKVIVVVDVVVVVEVGGNNDVDDGDVVCSCVGFTENSVPNAPGCCCDNSELKILMS